MKLSSQGTVVGAVQSLFGFACNAPDLTHFGLERTLPISRE
jgi:hypothetical protein